MSNLTSTDRIAEALAKTAIDRERASYQNAIIALRRALNLQGCSVTLKLKSSNGEVCLVNTSAIFEELEKHLINTRKDKLIAAEVRDFLQGIEKAQTHIANLESMVLDSES